MRLKFVILRNAILEAFKILSVLSKMYGTLRLMDSIPQGYYCPRRRCIQYYVAEIDFGFILKVCLDYSLSERDERAFEENVCHGVSVNQRSEDCSLHTVCDFFLFYGYPCNKRENITLQSPTSYGIRLTSDRHTSLCILKV